MDAILSPSPSSPHSGWDSPTGIDDSLDYITVETYEWPKPEPPRRFRLEDDERKRRHREGQRQFMARKRIRIKILRKEIEGLQAQLRVAQLYQQTTVLAQEKQLLHAQVGEQSAKIVQLGVPTFNVPSVDAPAALVETATTEVPEDIESLLIDVILSW